MGLAVWSGWAASQVPAENPPAQYGVAVGGFVSSFVGGMSGPSTLVSDTRYGDTFGTGGGARFEVYRKSAAGWRGQAGFVHSRWPGRLFTGGEFPNGAQFQAFSLSGIYVGGRIDGEAHGPFSAYALGNLGLVRLSGLQVTSGGQTVPYWAGNWRDYLEVGVGVSWAAGPRSALAADVRLQAFGAPRSANFPVGEATGGQSLLFGFAYEWDVR